MTKLKLLILSILILKSLSLLSQKKTTIEVISSASLPIKPDTSIYSIEYIGISDKKTIEKHHDDVVTNHFFASKGRKKIIDIKQGLKNLESIVIKSRYDTYYKNDDIYKDSLYYQKTTLYIRLPESNKESVLQKFKDIDSGVIISLKNQIVNNIDRTQLYNDAIKLARRKANGISKAIGKKIIRIKKIKEITSKNDLEGITELLKSGAHINDQLDKQMTGKTIANRFDTLLFGDRYRHLFILLSVEFEVK